MKKEIFGTAMLLMIAIFLQKQGSKRGEVTLNLGESLYWRAPYHIAFTQFEENVFVPENHLILSILQQENINVTFFPAFHSIHRAYTQQILSIGISNVQSSLSIYMKKLKNIQSMNMVLVLFTYHVIMKLMQKNCRSTVQMVNQLESTSRQIERGRGRGMGTWI